MSGPFEVHTVETTTHGRYLIRKANAEGPAPLLVGFHGYAQTAEEHLDALLELPGLAHWHIVAIEGLHRFYRSRTGDLAASWMTRQERELAIADNVRYVETALSDVKERLEVAAPLALFGFSQGTAMAYRAAASSGHRCSGHRCQGLVALCGDAPGEIFQGELDRFPRVLIGRGTEDEWYDEGKMRRDLERLEAVEAEVETLVFEGGHDFTPDFYRVAGKFLNSLPAAE